MRYKIVMLPFMGRYHVTLSWWDPSDPEAGKRCATYDVGPEDCQTEHLHSLLSFLAGEEAASRP
jgi:hypothetical protein